MVGFIEDVSYLKEFKFKVGDKIYLVGEMCDDFGGS